MIDKPEEEEITGDRSASAPAADTPLAAADSLPAARRRFTISPAWAAIALAVVLFLLSGFLPNGFGSNPDIAIPQATNIIRLAVFLGVIAAGQTLVILSGGEGIDLSAGAVVTVTAIITYSVVSGQNANVIPALLAALAAGAAIGFANGLGVALLRISPLVMTLSMSGVVTGLIVATTRGSVSGSIAPIMTQLIARPVFLGIPGAIVIWLIFGSLMWFLLNRTSYGKNLYAIGTNRTTARLSGISVNWMIVGTYALAGMLAGFGGFLVVGNAGVVHIRIGDPFLFPSIAAVAVGGTLLAGGKGSYFGTMAGALVLTLITSLLTTMQMDESVRRMVLGATLLVMISIYGRERGLRQ